MFTHITVGANDVEASRKFYDAALGALGLEPGQGPDAKGRYWWRTRMGAFAVGKPIDGEAKFGSALRKPPIGGDERAGQPQRKRQIQAVIHGVHQPGSSPSCVGKPRWTSVMISSRR